MKKRTLPFLMLLSILLFTSCNSGISYKYSDKEDGLKCEDASIDPKLVIEALHTFENDLMNIRARQQPIDLAYKNLLPYMNTNRKLHISKISEHTLEVFEEIKKINNLWIDNNSNTALNYQHPLIKCLGENIADTNLRDTYKALVSTNSMNSKIFSAPLFRNINNVYLDRHLATFLAFDVFYTHMFKIDNTELQQSNPINPQQANSKSYIKNNHD